MGELKKLDSLSLSLSLFLKVISEKKQKKKKIIVVWSIINFTYFDVFCLLFIKVLKKKSKFFSQFYLF